MIALDIDDTLTGKGQTSVPEATGAAVVAARRAGHHIVLASGRSLAGVLPIARALDLTGWVVASNGAIIARVDSTIEPDGYTIADGDARWVDVRTVTDIVTRFPQPGGIALALENIGKGYFVTHEFPKGMLRGTPTWAPLTVLKEHKTPRIVLSGSGVRSLVGRLRDAGLTATPAGPGSFDVTARGLSKATALEIVRERLGVDPARTVAVGDGINDIEALTWAARGVAMGHAPAQVRDVADEVTGTLQDDGAGAVLRSLLPKTARAGR